MAMQKCANGTCFSMTGPPQCAHAKADASAVVLKLLDERDPNDSKQHTRDLAGKFWREVGERYSQRALDAEAERAFAKTAHAARAILLDRLAVSSPGAGEFAPPVQLRRLGAGYLWPA